MNYTLMDSVEVDAARLKDAIDKVARHAANVRGDFALKCTINGVEPPDDRSIRLWPKTNTSNDVVIPFYHAVSIFEALRILQGKIAEGK